MVLSWYGITSILLGILLFFPIKKVILSLTVNRHEARVKREITEEELDRALAASHLPYLSKQDLLFTKAKGICRMLMR